MSKIAELTPATERHHNHEHRDDERDPATGHRGRYAPHQERAQLYSSGTVISGNRPKHVDDVAPRGRLRRHQPAAQTNQRGDNQGLD